MHIALITLLAAATEETAKAGKSIGLGVGGGLGAVGAGGLRGRGILGATQTRLNYLPEHATDFAFASLAEEHGFFGASILLLLYLLVVWRSLKIVAGARDLYCAIVAGGIAFMFLFQVFVNSAMTMGIAPITGIPLPFVSVGGSSMITNFLAIGILQAIHDAGWALVRPAQCPPCARWPCLRPVQLEKARSAAGFYKSPTSGAGSSSVGSPFR